MASKQALSMKSALYVVAAVLAAACGGAGTGSGAVSEAEAVVVSEAEAHESHVGEAVAPIVGSITIVPAQVRLERAGNVQFAAVARDQFGAPMAIPVFAWSATGGTVTADGRYTAGPWGGDFAVFAQAGTLEDSAAVTIER